MDFYGNMVSNLNKIDSTSVNLKTLLQWIFNLCTQPDNLMYPIIICSAIFPIFIGAHASLRCPSSAKATKEYSKKLTMGDVDEDEDNDFIELLPEVQGLQPSDALIMPVLAGILLGGLYLLIKWLDDPKLLNSILNWYFSGLGVIGVGKLAGDSLNVITSFVFPSVWSTKKEIYFIESAILSQSTGLHMRQGENHICLKSVDAKTNPFPGLLSSVQFPISITSIIWSCRELFTNQWVFRAYIRSFMRTVMPVRLNDVVGYALGLVIIIIYNIYAKNWWLNNLIAFGFCYGTLQILSPTTFWTGSLVLFGLFIYDIMMVFYTPLMITVATSLDVPIKLVFPSPNRQSLSELGVVSAKPKYGSILGLGDIVLPGLMIALALRFDLYLHYLSKQKSHQDTNQNTLIKPSYTEATGFWGERFWTSRYQLDTQYENVFRGGNFKKIYFWTGIFAYVIGLIVTYFVMRIFEHGQPALLYLVPGVLFALWGVAWTRGEILLMWRYSEDKELEPQDEEDRNDTIQPSEKSQNLLEADRVKDETKASDTSLSERKKRHDKYAERIFSFSLSAR